MKEDIAVKNNRPIKIILMEIITIKLELKIRIIVKINSCNKLIY